MPPATRERIIVAGHCPRRYPLFAFAAGRQNSTFNCKRNQFRGILAGNWARWAGFSAFFWKYRCKIELYTYNRRHSTNSWRNKCLKRKTATRRRRPPALKNPVAVAPPSLPAKPLPPLPRRSVVVHPSRQRLLPPHRRSVAARRNQPLPPLPRRKNGVVHPSRQVRLPLRRKSADVRPSRQPPQPLRQRSVVVLLALLQPLR